MTTGSRRLPVLACSLVMLLVLPAGVRALAPTGELRAIFDEANRVLNDPATEARPLDRLSAILEIVDRVFAYDEAARLALGREWDLRTPAEREEFVRLFADFLQRTFVLTVASKASLEGGVEIRYASESVSGDTATVVTMIVSRSGKEIPIEYRMIRRGGGWAIQDVIWDSVSLVGNYHAQFQRVIRTSSYADLVARMRTKSLEVATLLPFARGENGHAGGPANPTPSSPAPPSPAPPLAVTAAGRAEVRVQPLEGAEPAAVSTPGPIVTAAARDHSPAVPPTAGAAAPSAARGVPLERPAPNAVDAPSVEAGQRDAGSAAARPSGASSAAASAGLAQPERSAPGTVPSEPKPGDSPRVALAPAPVPDRPPAHESPAPPRSQPVSGLTYWVQVGAFKSVESATRVAEALLEQNLAVALDSTDITVAGDPVRVVRVRVGPFADRVAVATALRDLARKGYAPFLAIDRH